ncbi:hypothetical protein KY290_012129 [Solanum tuberosum]|uniref:Heparanase n=1 Tax=Solanum tuberosum TaxID=4113 RepID=A0ABQ7W580_SOLTU|nr:hypothetical protein KY290_012129 [Solanum tuberosum]
MTGVTSAPWRESLRTPPRSSSLFSSVFVLSGGTHTSNLLSLISRNSCEFLCQTTSLDFLAKYQFDFNLCVCEAASFNLYESTSACLSHMRWAQTLTERAYDPVTQVVMAILRFWICLTPFVAYSIQAFNNLRLRLGSSLQNRIIYDVGNLELPCHLFTKQGDELFGFSNGCLRMDKWDELYRFFNKTGALVTFGLNALRGRQRTSKRVWEGNWDSSNAHDFIDYTVSKGYQIHSWEFGNELSGKGIGAKVDAEQYREYVIHLNNLIDQLYKHFQPRPLLLALGGFYDKELFEMFLEMSGPGTVDALTHHIYNLGPAKEKKLQNYINRLYLSWVSGGVIDLSTGKCTTKSASSNIFAISISIPLYLGRPFQYAKNSCEFLCQTTSLDFLAKYQFDFNMCVREAAGFNLYESTSACQSHRRRAQTLTELVYDPVTQVVMAMLRFWNLLFIQKPRRGSTRPYKFDIHGGIIRFPVWLERRCRLPIGVATSPQQLIVYTHSNDDRDLLMKEVKDDRRKEAKIKVKSAVGFRLIDLLSSERKLIVDMAHMYSKFIGPLPSTTRTMYLPFRSVKTSGLADRPCVEVEVRIDAKSSSISKKLFADQAEAVGIKHKTVSSRAEGDKKGNQVFDKENEERMFDEKVDDEMSPSYGYSERDSSAESFYVDEVLASK